MKTKGNAGHLIAVIVLAVLLLAGVVLCGALWMGLGTEKLSQTREAAGPAPLGNNAQETGEDETVTAGIDAFVITAPGGAAADQTQTEAGDPAAADPQQPAGEEAAYLCDYSAQRPLTEADVEAYRAGVYEGLPTGKNVFQMIINEIYARHGYQFQNAEIQAYFDQKEWYQAITERNGDMNAVLAGMSEVEKANVEFLSGYGEEE